MDDWAKYSVMTVNKFLARNKLDSGNNSIIIEVLQVEIFQTPLLVVRN